MRVLRDSRWGSLVVAATLVAGVVSCGSGDDGAGCDAPADGRSMAGLWIDTNLDAVRRAVPAPTVHSRNMFHLSALMWDVWAAYDESAQGLFVSADRTATDVEAERRTAIAFGARHLIEYRYRLETRGRWAAADSDDILAELCGVGGGGELDERLESDPVAAFGVEVAQAIIDASVDDGSDELAVYHDDDYSPVNEPMDVEVSGAGITDPNRWQPLVLGTVITQNGIELPADPQVFIGSQWGHVRPFALGPPGPDGLPIDPGPPPMLGTAEFAEAVTEVITAAAQLEVGLESIDISPSARGNNALGTNDGAGWLLNPVTNQPYEPNVVDHADYGRVIAEFWADGPDSETPPGHWNVLAAEVADELGPEGLRLGGEGEVMNRLEWDVKMALALNGAMHDAAIAAWGAKAHFDYVRPISMIRHMAELGQSSDPDDADTFHRDGLELVDGVVEVITVESSSGGGRHAHLADHVGEIAVRSWRGGPEDPETETSGVGWILGVDWVPYQRPTFVTPSFAAYVSGHSTFSRAGAEILTAMTGSPFFPGGLAEHTTEAGDLLHEEGPTSAVTLQWATYADAADEAGRSRIYGGIHVAADDFAGRTMGAEVGRLAWERALELFG